MKESIERTDLAQAHFDKELAEAKAYCEQRRSGLIGPFDDPITSLNEPVLAEKPSFYNGQTAFDYGLKEGYEKGEAERIALAIANTNLRSEVRELRNVLLEAKRLARASAPYFSILNVLDVAEVGR